MSFRTPLGTLISMMPPRYLLLSDIFPPKTGGSGRWFWEIYSRLDANQVLIAAGEDDRASDFDKAHEVAIRRLPIEMKTRGLRPFANLKHYCRLARRVKRIVKKERIDFIHAARNLPEGFVAYLVRKMLGTPYLCYVHGEDVGVSATSRELAWMTRRVFAGASAIIANSRNTRSILLNDWKLPDAKVRLVHPGVDVNRFVPVEPNETVQRELGWHGKRVILTVGRLQKRKGHDMLIRALKTIGKHHPNVIYAILGDGEERTNLEALAAAEGVTDSVRFLGEVSDQQLLHCYQQCEIFVLPNRQIGNDIEGFGMVLLEAQACGKPVVAGASGGTAETMCIPDTGCVLPCDSPDALARLLVDLLHDPDRLRDMGIRGRKWVSENFDWHQLGMQAEQVFLSLVPK